MILLINSTKHYFCGTSLKKKNTMKETSDEKIAYRGILLITICEVLAMLFFYAINGGL